MPDISMCNNKECEDRFTCYRYLAVASDWQSFIRPTSKNKKECNHYCKWDGSTIIDESRLSYESEDIE